MGDPTKIGLVHYQCFTDACSLNLCGSGECLLDSSSDLGYLCKCPDGTIDQDCGGNCYILAASWENQQSAYAKTKAQISFAVTATLICAFVFATRIGQFLLYLTTKFQASSSFLCLYRPVCVGPVRKPPCWFSHEVAHFIIYLPK